jgi:hypothetical protein
MTVLLIALWLSMSPGAVYGQGSTWAGAGLARMLEAAMWRSGILRANAAFQLSNAGYDSDIYYGFFGETVPDVTFSAGVPVQLLLSLDKTTVLELYDNVRYDFFLNTEHERAWNNVFRGRLHVALTKVYFRVGGELANNRQRLSQELYINVREKTKRLDSLALWQVSRATSLALLYDKTNFDYSDVMYHGTSLAETLNRKVDSLEFVAFVHADPGFRFFIDGQYGNYAFTNLASQPKNTRSFAVFGGFVSVLQEDSPNRVSRVGRIEGYARLGYMKFDVLDIAQPDGYGLVGDVDLSMGIFRLTNARLFYSKGFDFSIYEAATFFAEQSYGIGLAHLFSRRTTLSYDLTFGQSSYPTTGTAEGAPSGVLYRFRTHMMSLSTTLTRYFRISLTGTLGRRVTAETGQVWNRYTIGLSLDYGTPASPDTGPAGGLLRSSSGIAY